MSTKPTTSPYAEPNESIPLPSAVSIKSILVLYLVLVYPSDLPLDLANVLLYACALSSVLVAFSVNINRDLIILIV
jgi:predicted membrane chloride channel (bestrophin family)